MGAQVNYWCRIGEGAGVATANGVSSHAPILRPSHTLRYPANLSLGNLAYFLAAPTLCYELTFPRTARFRKWSLTFSPRNRIEDIGRDVVGGSSSSDSWR